MLCGDNDSGEQFSGFSRQDFRFQISNYSFILNLPGLMLQITPATSLKNSAQRPTVCHVIHALGVGGAEVLVDVLMRQLDSEYRSVVAVLDEIGDIGQRLQAD